MASVPTWVELRTANIAEPLCCEQDFTNCYTTDTREIHNRRALGRALHKLTLSGTITEKLGAAYRGVWKALKEVSVSPGMEPKRRAAKIAAVAGFNKTARRAARPIKILHGLIEREGERNIGAVHTDNDLQDYWEHMEALKAKNALGGALPKPHLLVRNGKQRGIGWV